MKIGVIGLGVVGGAVFKAFSTRIETIGFDIVGPYSSEDNFTKMVAEADVIFVCVPTPTINFEQAQDAAFETMFRLEKEKFAGVVCLKSTVTPGTCRALKARFPGLRLTHNPEFLTAAKPFEDFMNQKCVIISGAADDTAVVQRTYEELFPGIPVTTNEDFEVTEIAKYMRNCFLAVKVAFANEIAHVCEKNNVPYNDVLGMMLSQGGIEPGHFKVPGPDGKRGYGGACFPKDVRALMTYAQKNGVVSFILRAAETLNQVIRPHDANCKEIN